MWEWGLLPAAALAALVSGVVAQRVHDHWRGTRVRRWGAARSLQYESPGQPTLLVDWAPVFDALPGEVTVVESLLGALEERSAMLCSLRVRLERVTCSLSVVAVRAPGGGSELRLPPHVARALGVDCEPSGESYGVLRSPSHVSLVYAGRLSPKTLATAEGAVGDLLRSLPADPA